MFAVLFQLRTILTLRRLALTVLGCFLAWQIWDWLPAPAPGGDPAPQAPQQTAITMPSFTYHDYTLTPQAAFALEARVLSRSNYHFDAGAALAPVDLALGWQQMATNAVLEHLWIGQGQRFYFYRWWGEPPLAPELIVRQSANMHLIPATRAIASLLRVLPRNAIIRLKGYLVNAAGRNGFTWSTSLTRDDSGYGACELVYVTELTRLY